MMMWLILQTDQVLSNAVTEQKEEVMLSLPHIILIFGQESDWDYIAIN